MRGKSLTYRKPGYFHPVYDRNLQIQDLNHFKPLRADIAALEAAISDQSSGQGQSIAAGASIEQAIDDGVVAVRKFDVIIRNKYANDRAVLAEWTSVSHTERDPRHKSTPKAPATPTPGSPSGGSGTTAPPAGGSSTA